ncbi:MAG: alkaline phosphatase family protein [Paludibacteraceae bacterium]|nr:alkaline phosphatase family protein [Paludibacteraceae bacterium]
MHKTFLYWTLALCLAMPAAAKQLTVIVAVDGLEPSALREMQPYWTQGGLRTLSEEAYQTSIAFPHWLYGGEESLATILTGRYPSEHGVCANYAFSRATRQVYDVFRSDRRLGIGTADSYTADALLVPTVTDRLRLTGNTSARIYAVGLHPSTAVMLGGHGANAVCWPERNSRTDSMRWVSTSYYRDGLPSEADRINISGRLGAIVSREWTPSMDINSYNHPTDEERKHPFAYRGADCFFTSPNANAAVIDLALAMQSAYRLGQQTFNDVLLLEMTVITPKTAQAQILSAEQEDMYVRLNSDLGLLFSQLEKRVGKESLRIVLIGLPRLGTNAARLQEWNMPIHTFNADRAVALTSSYLMAIYGHERWIDGSCGPSIYLNRTLIEQKHLSLETFRRQVADFLMEFEGVRYACPASEAYLHPDMMHSVHKRYMGDVMYMLQPDYLFMDESVRVPFFLWSGTPISFPPALHSATEVSEYIL